MVCPKVTLTNTKKKKEFKVKQYHEYLGLNKTIFFAFCVASNNTRLFELPIELQYLITTMATRRRNTSGFRFL